MAKSLKWHIYQRVLAIMDAGRCTGHLATDAAGRPTAVDSRRARHFCAVSALERAQAEFGARLIKLSPRSAKIWMATNDQDGKEAVQRLIKKRLARL
jgi:hypothetical protein